MEKSGASWGPEGFHGEHHYRADEKGRVVVPPAFREWLESQDRPPVFMVAPGLEKCLFLYDMPEWSRLVARCRQEKALPSADQRKFERLFIARAARVESDAQGRVMIPETLKEHSGIERDVVFVGMGWRAEIWDLERWKAYREQNEDDLARAADAMGI